MDIMQDDRILKDYASELLKAKPFNGLTSKGLELLKSSVNMASKSKHNKTRLARALFLLNKSVDWQQERTELFNQLLNSEQGKEQLDEFLNKNEEDFFTKYRIEKFNIVENTINDEITKLKIKESSLRSTIRELGKEADDKRKEQAEMEAEYRAKAEDKVRKELEQEKEELQQEVSRIKEKLFKFKEEYNQYKNLNDLIEKNKKLSDEHAGLTSLNIGLNNTKDDLEKTIVSASTQLTEEYVRVHSLFKAMTSPIKNNVISNLFKEEESEGISRVNNMDSIHSARQEYIDAMEVTLSKYDRNLSREQVVNIVVTLAQSQFTILSGLPGSGKTSLVKIIGKAMQLGSRQHTIPVAKSWTSMKDILGYYNGLSGSYHSAPTGLWDLLNSVQSDDSEKVLPVLLLLDEMNLSSPEHYFSSFLDLADNESKREIFTGHPDIELLSVPDHVKFIGTINQDETVQPLSPRMLDRSAVILFDGVTNNTPVSKDSNIRLPKYPAKDWIDLFSSNGESIPENIKIALENVSNCLSENNIELGQRHIISHRKKKKILDYIEVSNSILIDFDDFISLDHAISQYVLPMISGYGEAYGRRLNNLNEILQIHSMKLSSGILKDIIMIGEQNLYSYKFPA
ncbi:ATP-binding protein [Enterovibrio norvegicus]|uniref:AAA domain (Dynein-related subfamily) n=1 Tax=Enterovibrio norvegicus DSM 15893 TaxID=1121869 RepID=A0A1I5T6A7_9GAMM|nr:ATP-binding protein [Enterovibrio norvegicus]SFP78026.1 hypothetical protein SAMN03084138_03094 [Enterovibrio norvegicus DSM 15893]